MHPVLLIDELRDYMKTVVSEFVLSTGHNHKKAPQVLDWGLPLKKSTTEPDYPFVVVRLLGGKDADEESIAAVRIYVGTTSEDMTGYEDAVNIIIRIRNALLEKRTLAGKYRLQLPLEWDIPEEQKYPQWIGLIDTTWIIAQPVEIAEEVDYGYE